MRVALITGASGGLGSALCKALASRGDRIVLHYFTGKHNAEDTAREIRSQGSQAILYEGDLRYSATVHGLANTALKKWGRIDLWVNNAGITLDRSVENLTEAEWSEVVSVNLSAAYYGTREAAVVMKEQKQGHIINIASLVGQKGGAGQSAYAAAKAGLVGLTKTAARELGPFNILANAVCPGYLSTAMTLKLPHRHRQALIAENVLGRGSTLEEVARFICHLSAMEHVSGQIFNLDSRIL